MNTSIKVILISLLASAFAFAGPKIFFTEGDQVKLEYEAFYKSIIIKDEPTEEDKKKLEAMFQKINAATNIQAEVIEKTIRYALFLGVLLPLMFIIGRKVNLSRDGIFAVCGITFAAFIVAGSMLIGALVTTLFFIASQSKTKQATTEGDTTS